VNVFWLYQTAPIVNVLSFVLVLLKAVKSVLLPLSKGVQIPLSAVSGNATSVDAGPMAPVVLGSLSLSLPRPFGSFVMLSEQALPHITTKLECVKLNPLFCEARWQLSLFCTKASLQSRLCLHCSFSSDSCAVYLQ
jgi:hypothetical protein